MAKIFSTIVNQVKLENRYQESLRVSGVNEFNSTLKAVSSSVADDHVLSVETNPNASFAGSKSRTKKLYDKYTSSSVSTVPEQINYSPLIKPVTLTRLRSTEFYSTFPVVNKAIQYSPGALDAKNNTLIEIKPYSVSSSLTNDYGVQALDFAVPQADIKNSTQFVQSTRDVIRLTNFFGPQVRGPLTNIIATALSANAAAQIGSNFTATSRATNFLSNQIRLQGRNTFVQSRKYNVFSVLQQSLNYTLAPNNINEEGSPVLEHQPRIIQSRLTENPNLAGRIQRQSVVKIQQQIKSSFVGGVLGSFLPERQQSELAKLSEQYLRTKVLGVEIKTPGFIKNLANFANKKLGTQFEPQNNYTIGQIGAKINNVLAFTAALTTDINNATLSVNQTAYDALYTARLWPLMKQPYGGSIDGSPAIRNYHDVRDDYVRRARAAITNDKKLIAGINRTNQNTQEYPRDDYRSTADFTEIVRSVKSRDGGWFGTPTATYLNDSFNIVNRTPVTDAKVFDRVPENQRPQDYIKFVIKVPEVFSNGIYFRAFLEDINHSTKGEYESVRYVGRPERFINYRGMNRTLTFSMYLVAFSPEELDGIWTRCNMLNKLMYPIDNSGGYMIPPIAKITIGNLLQDQPGYVETVDMRLTEIPWDIDRELPQAVKLNMTYNIIEDAYITQKMTTEQFAQLFNKRRNENATGGRTTDSRGTTGTGGASPLNRREVAQSAQDAARGLTNTIRTVGDRFPGIFPRRNA